jgi:hypothetical protein
MQCMQAASGPLGQPGMHLWAARGPSGRSGGAAPSRLAPALSINAPHPRTPAAPRPSARCPRPRSSLRRPCAHIRVQCIHWHSRGSLRAMTLGPGPLPLRYRRGQGPRHLVAAARPHTHAQPCPVGPRAAGASPAACPTRNDLEDPARCPAAAQPGPGRACDRCPGSVAGSVVRAKTTFFYFSDFSRLLGFRGLGKRFRV